MITENEDQRQLQHEAGRDMLFEITDLLNPSQSGSIFETWMKTNFHQSGFGRKQLQVVEGSTTVTIYPTTF